MRMSIPPPLISRASIAAMRAAATRLLAPQFVEAVGLVEQPILQPIFDLESQRIAFGRVAIIGDAAFVARPHVGGGVAKAAGDAQALVAALVSEQRCAGGACGNSKRRGCRPGGAWCSARAISAPICRPRAARRKPRMRRVTRFRRRCWRKPRRWIFCTRERVACLTRASPRSGDPVEAGHSRLRGSERSRAATSSFSSFLFTPRHLLQHAADRAGILLGIADRHRRGIDRQRRAEQRRRHAELGWRIRRSPPCPSARHNSSWWLRSNRPSPSSVRASRTCANCRRRHWRT